mgnify:CR=1 FL=1
MLYLDTNVFLYASYRENRFYEDATSLLKRFSTREVPITTSSETLQEIIHYAKNLKRLKLGLKVCRKLLEIVSEPLPVNTIIIEGFLKIVEKYPRLESRDCLHLAVCLENNVDALVTEDKHLGKVKEVKSYTIKEALEKYGQNLRTN